MRIIHALEEIPSHECDGIFLAGPTPRDSHTPSWRPEAIKILNDIGYQGVVYVPEGRDWQPHGDYTGQIDWEWAALEKAAKIVFWVPRVLPQMPAFTTNVEFGLYAKSGKAVLGYPPQAEKMRYLDALAKRFDIPVFDTLPKMLSSLT